jgi:L-alanine-DL-glutamate epimerase-like enolase superfamily enzyme
VKIERIDIHRGRVGYWAGIAHATYEHFDMAVIELRSGEHVGWGEVIVDGDEDVAVLSGMAAGLLGPELTGPSAALPDRHEDRPHGTYRACREGLSMALYDLFGQARGISVAELLGGARRSRVPLMPCVTLAPPEAMEKRAADWAGAGYRFLKIKLRGSREEDLQVVERIRRAVGSDVELMTDANSGYREVETAVNVIRDLERLGVTVVEDIYDGPLGDYRRIREGISAKLMVDRHGYWPNVLNVLKEQAADAVNLHPRNVGGLDVGLRIDAACRQEGVLTRIGASHVLGIGDAAFQILGSVTALDMPVEDLGPLRFESHYGGSSEHYPADEKRMIVRELFPVENGEVVLADAPGLGVEVDRQKLAAMTTDTFEVQPA